MKKFLPLFILAVMALARGTCFATDYNLIVGGISVTSDNASHISGPTFEEGWASFDPSTNTLTLNNALIRYLGNGSDGIKNMGIDELTIKLVGENLIAAGDDGIETNNYSLTILGPGSLGISASYGIYGYPSGNKAITIRDGALVTINATSIGVSYSTGTLSVNQAELWAIGNSSCVHCAALNTTNTSIFMPAGASFSGSYVCDSQGAMVAGSYVVITPNLKVKGNLVTVSNCTDVLGDGMVRFDYGSRELTLRGVNMNPSSNVRCIENFGRPLTIKLMSYNNVNSIGTACIYSSGPLVIEGSGILEVSGNDGIWVNGADLTIRGGCSVWVCGTSNSSSNSAFYGASGNTFTIDKAWVTAFTRQQNNVNNPNGPVYGFGNFNLVDCVIDNPWGARWNSSTRRLEIDNSAIVTSQDNKLEIIPTPYHIKVSGIDVDATNYTDVLGDGTVYYDPDDNILTLEEANINHSTDDGDGIQINNDGLIVKLIGSNTITSADDGIQLDDASITIQGPGSLVVNSEYGIYGSPSNSQGNTITFEQNCFVVFDSHYQGINYQNGTVTVDRAIVWARTSAQSYGGVQCANLDLQGTEITSPQGAYFADGYVRDGNTGNPVNGSTYVKIEPIYYGIQVDQYLVTSINAADILGDGTASYNAATNTLTLDNVYLSGNDSGIHVTDNDGLRINLVGTNSIAYSGMDMHNSTVTISGPGSLYITANDPIYVDRGDLTLDRSCHLILTSSKAQGSSSCISGNPQSTLTIDRSYVTCYLNSPDGCGISGFCTLDLTGVKFDTPSDGSYVSVDGVYSNGNLYHGQIVISPITYNLWVCGTQVNEAIAHDIMGDGGSVRYNAEYNVLYLENAEISANGLQTYSILNEIDDLTINLIGSNTIYNDSQWHPGIASAQHDLTINGQGELTIMTTSKGITASNSDLSIEGGCSIQIETSGVNSEAIFAWPSCSITNSHVLASAPNSANGAFHISGNFTMTGCGISSPTGAYWDSNTCNIVDGNGDVVTTVEINMFRYDLYVAGERITSVNCDDVLGDGTVRYNPTENTLYLTNAYIDVEEEYGIANYIDGLVIHLSGASIVNSTEIGIMSVNSTLAIMGEGNLDVYGLDGIRMLNGSLDILGGCTVSAHCLSNDPASSNGAIVGASNSLFTVYNSSVYLYSSATAVGVLSGFRSVELTGCLFVPSDCQWNAVRHRLEREGQPAVEVAILPYYLPLYVAGTQVTLQNMNNITGEGIESGRVSYEPLSKTLTLEDAVLNNTSLYFSGIDNMIEGLTIKLIGHSYLDNYSEDHLGILSYKASLMMEGPGRLDLYSQSDAIAVDDGNFYVLDGCQLYANVSQGNIGIYGTDRFVVQNSTVHVETYANGPDGVISGFRELVLSGCDYSYPVGAAWNSTTRRVECGGNIVTNVTIIPNQCGLMVGNVIVDTGNAPNITGEGITGRVSYNPLSKTLTLENATIVDLELNGVGITSMIDVLSIKLIGHNTIRAASKGIELYQGSAGLFGPGSLSIGAPIGIYSNDSSESFSIGLGCDVNIVSSQYGINVAGTLVVNESTVTVRGNAVSVVCGGFFPGYYTHIFAPSHAEYNSNEACICYAGTNVGVWGENVIITSQLKVQNILVDASNCNDVLGDNGSVIYDPTWKTLTLTDANIQSSSYGIENHLNGLDIVLVGNNSITASSSGIYSYSSELTIEGAPTSQLFVEGSDGIYVRESNLLIQGGCLVHSTGTYAGNYAGIYGTVGGILMVRGSTVYASNDNGLKSGICGFGSFILEDCSITLPEGGYWDGNALLVRDESDHIAQSVMISPTNYNVTVGGIEVTAANYFDVLNNGTVYYDPGTNVLTLDNTRIIDPVNNSGIINRNDGLVINLIGENYIDVDGDGINTERTATIITGQGSLFIEALSGVYGYYGSSLTITDGPYVDITATHYGVMLANGELTVRNAQLNAQTTQVEASQGSICAAYLTLEGCSITMPHGAYWYPYDGNPVYVKVNNQIVKDQVVIAPDAFDLTVSGITVTTANAPDVLVDGGHVSYDIENNVLVLENANIYNQSGYQGISNYIEGLTIRVVGSNYITSNSSGIYSGQDADLVIEGTSDDYLEVTGTDGIYAFLCDLTIQGGCTVKATGTNPSSVYSGVYGMPMQHFNIINSTLIAQKENGLYYAISGFEPQLTGCEITTPSEPITWSDGHYVDGNGGAVDGQIIISPLELDLWIGGRQVTTANASDILGNGMASYDAENNVLTLNNANIVNTTLGGPDGSDGIYHRISGLTIELVGDNYLEAGDDGINGGFMPTTITGRGTLTIVAPYGIYSVDSYFTLAGASTIIINSSQRAINCGYYGRLTIDDATLYAEGGNDGPVKAGEIITQWVDITVPMDGSVYHSDLYGSYFVDANNDGNLERVELEAYNVFDGATDSDWSEDSNWSFGYAPTIDDRVGIDDACALNGFGNAYKIAFGNQGVLTMNSNARLAADIIVNDDWDKLVVEDGAELIHFNNGVAATVKKNISGYGNGNGGYYLISSPFRNGIYINYNAQHGGTNLATGNYDLYSYDEPTAYWINYKDVNAYDEHPFYMMGIGLGCLYANHDNITLTMKSNDGMGLSNVSVGVYRPLSHVGDHLNGFNLIGNLFLCNMDVIISSSDFESFAMTDYYVMNAYGTELEAVAAGTPLSPLAGAFVEYYEGFPNFIYSYTGGFSYDRASAGPAFDLSVSKDEEDAKALNNVILHSGEGLNMSKLLLDESSTSLSVVSDGKEYGSFYYDGEATLTLRFKAAEQGRYVISLSGAKEAILLRDTLTGIVTDLSQGSYSFEASPTDSAERFEVMVK